MQLFGVRQSADDLFIENKFDNIIELSLEATCILLPKSDIFIIVLEN
jgi:hypothetical protein